MKLNHDSGAKLGSARYSTHGRNRPEGEREKIMAWAATDKRYVPLAQAEEVALALSVKLGFAGASRVTVTGSIRRQKPTVGDIDMVLVSPDKDPRELLQACGATVVQGGTERAFGFFQELAVNVWRCASESYGAMIFYTTGPAQYAIAYRMKAKRAGLLLNEKGLFRDGKMIAGETEESIYEALGKQWKRPTLRGAK